MKVAAFPLLFCALACLARAEEAKPASTENLDEIIQRRIAILTKITENAKAGLQIGTIGTEEVRQAWLDLYVLRRDTAKTLAECLSWQDQIIALEQQRQAEAKQQYASGSITSTDLLRSEERVLAAKQRRLELEARR